ncbi:MAG TPA: ATP-binding protein [Nannocystaceae bacterium]|nr:ATP-binding protein [Nannocystaceae bacterium]
MTSTLLAAAVLVTAATGATLMRADARAERGPALRLTAIACLRALPLVFGWTIAWWDAVLGVLATTATWRFFLAFPSATLPAGPAQTIETVGIVAAIGVVLVPDPWLGEVARHTATAAAGGAVVLAAVRLRSLSHPRARALTLVAATAVACAWGLAALRGGELTGSIAGLAAAFVVDAVLFVYAVVSLRSWLRAVGLAFAVGAVALALVVVVRRFGAWYQPWIPEPEEIGLAVTLAVGGLAGLGLFARALGRVDAGATPGIDSSTRETMVAVDRLTDPMAVQRRVVDAVRGLVPGARLELLRCRATPTTALANAREIGLALVDAAVRRGYVLSHQVDELAPVVAREFTDLGGGLLVPVRAGASVFGLLHVARDGIDSTALVGARRLADMLGLKLETHRLYAELEQQRRLAALGTLVSALAHDIRTPLTAIRMNAQLLQRRAAQLGADAESLAIVITEVDRLGQLVGNMLDFSRPIALAPGVVDVRELLDDCLRQVAASGAGIDVGVVVEIDGALPAVPGDRVRLQRAVTNVLQNALQSGSRSAVRVRVRVDDGAVEIEVKDEGRGIDPADLPRVLEPFFTTKTEGTGLGLAIVDKIVRAHGGKVQVKSVLELGTEVRLRLPMLVAPGAVRAPAPNPRA